jgi:hypothetical protein
VKEKMCEKKQVHVPIPLADWPELDRNGVMMSRMTLEPQPTRIHLVTANAEENIE